MHNKSWQQGRFALGQLTLRSSRPFNRAEVESWVLCMQKAVDEQPCKESFKVYLIEQLRVPAERIFSACNI